MEPPVLKCMETICGSQALTRSSVSGRCVELVQV